MHHKKQLLEELKSLDAKEGDFGLFDRENCHRAELRSQVEHLLSLEEISWRQKSRMLVSRKGIITSSFSTKRLTPIEGLIIYGPCTRRLRGGGLSLRVWNLIVLRIWRGFGLKGSLRERKFFKL